jgi:hypothetical protein
MTSPGYLPKNTEANEDEVFYLDKCKHCFIDRLTFRLAKESTEIANYNHHCSKVASIEWPMANFAVVYTILNCLS